MTKLPRSVMRTRHRASTLFGRGLRHSGHARERHGPGDIHIQPAPRFSSVMATTATMRSHPMTQARLSSRGALASSRQLSKTSRAATRDARRVVTRATGAPATSAEKRTATNALTKQDLVDYIASGCKPKSEWRCAPTRSVIPPSLSLSTPFLSPRGRKKRWVPTSPSPAYRMRPRR